jgi:CHAT domain-containing protein
MLHAANRYLGRLYDGLVRPWIDDVDAAQVVVVPHGEMHSLPFHAFFDGERHLIDRLRIVYAPSAEVFRRGVNAARPAGGEGLLVGLPDPAAPAIADEIGRIRALAPESRVLLEEEASRSNFFEYASSARFIHVSTHSFFRRDNPMFSGFHLSDGPVTALDLYSQSWPNELVTLSGCSSGLARVAGGDDLMGLTRGFLYAGARSLLVSLWNVSDEATVLLTEIFYREWLNGTNKSRALEAAMRRVRDLHPHPFHWAPFVLIGAP